MADAAEIDAPLVFQCKGCRSVLGDSLSFLVSDEATRTITLNGVTQVVVVGTELLTSKEGRDMGSSFVRFQCGTCQASIGRVYKATPRDLDDLRDRFTFDIDLISSYQLGSVAAGGRFTSTDDLLPIPSLRNLEQDIIKIQQLMMAMHDRLEALEQQQATAAGAPASAPAAGSESGQPSPVGAQGAKRPRGAS